MLKKKEYCEILQKSMSHIQVVQLFNELFNPKPAIRIVDTDYHNGEREYTLSCDKCGGKFKRTVNTRDDSQLTKKEATCPHCNHFMERKYSTYWKKNTKVYCVEDNYQHYQSVLSDDEIIQPTLQLFEEINLDGKVYYVIRRFIFGLSGGTVSTISMFRCLIIPQEAHHNFATLYENSVGDTVVSRTEHPLKWYEHTNYREPGCVNYHYCGKLKEEADTKENDHAYLKSFMPLLNESMEYYSNEAISIRTVLSKYSVNDIPEKFVSDKAYAENHGDYIVMRMFEDEDGEAVESKRMIFSVKDRYICLLYKYCGKWHSDYVESSNTFKDDDFKEVQEELSNTFVGKMGLYQYLEEKTGIYYYKTSFAASYLHDLITHPIIEKLLKVGLPQLIDAVVDNKITLYHRANTLWQILGLSKANYRFALEAKLSVDEFKKLQSIDKFDQNVDRDAFMKWIDQLKDVSSYSLECIAEYTGLKLKEMLEYIESLYFNQGMEFSDGATEWKDYLFMFKQYYKRKVKGSAELYPDSLRREHDVLNMRNNKWASEHGVVGKSFGEIIEKWNYLEFSDKSFEIILPKNSRDVVLEGQALSHCVGSYVKSIVDGRCLILFIRRKGYEDKSFMTMEYDLKNSIRQIKGHSNHTLSDLALRDAKMYLGLVKFLTRWGKKNKIDVGLPNAENAA